VAMKKIWMVLLFLGITLFAKTDYSEMSTEELLAMMGYVAPQSQKVLQQELKIRVPQMSPQEKKTYEENLKKMKK
jgi:hypothetical protein